MRTQPHEAPLDPHLLARLVSVRDSPDFASELLVAAQQFDAVQEVFAYQIGSARFPPLVLLSSSGQDGSDHRVASWVSDFHSIDPLVASRRTASAGTGLTRCVRASEIRDPVYREVCFEDPRFIDKLSFVWQDDNQSLVLNFYRGRGSRGRLSGRLATLANIGLATAAAHARTAPASPRQGRDIDWIEARIALRFPQLTMRERQVCARTLAGWSARTIADALGISAGTVLTYRQRAYARFDFSRASDFLPGLMD